MQMFIPHPQQKLRLLEDWTFKLYHESRNADLFEALELKGGLYDHEKFQEATLPAGTVLTVQRIYIRGSYRQYDSVTFRTTASPDSRLASKKQGGSGKSRRFWAKLADVNTMQIEIAEDL